MKKTLKRRFKLFWLWQEDKEMEWLRRMSQKGWHLVSVCVFIYTFQQGEPVDTRYYSDFRSIKKTDVEEYLEIFRDTGWEYVCRQGNWFYFSSPADNKHQEVYTDNHSRLAKYRALLLMHIIFFPLLFNSIRIVSGRMADNGTILMGILMFITFMVFLALIYSTIRLIILVSKLNKSPKE